MHLNISPVSLLAHAHAETQRAQSEHDARDGERDTRDTEWRVGVVEDWWCE